MVACTRTRCHGPAACDCMGSQSKKRKQVVMDEDSRPCKARKTLEHGTAPPAQQYNKRIRRKPRACKPRSRQSDGDARQAIADYSREEKSLPTPSESNSTWRIYMNPHPPLSSLLAPRALPSPTSSNEHRQSNNGYRSLGPSSPIYREQRLDKSSAAQLARLGVRGSMAGDVAKKDYIDDTALQNCAKVTDERLSALRRSQDGDFACSGSHGAALGPSIPLHTNRSTPLEYASDVFYNLGPSIPPPSNQLTPPEYAMVTPADPNFLDNFKEALRGSLYSDALRKRKYGEDVTNEYRRGLTPEEHRERWQAEVERQLRDAEEATDSDEAVRG